MEKDKELKSTKEKVKSEKIKEQPAGDKIKMAVDCSYGIRMFNEKGEKVVFERKFTAGEIAEIDPKLKIPFRESYISKDIAKMIINNQQGGYFNG